MSTFECVLELGEAIVNGGVLRGDTIHVDTRALSMMSARDLQRLARIIRCGGVDVVPRAGLASLFSLSYTGHGAVDATALCAGVRP